MRRVLLATFGGLSVSGVAAIALAAPAADPAAVTANIEQAQPAAKNIRFELGAASAGIAAEKKLLPKGVKTLLKVPQTLEHGDYVWNDEGVAPGKLTVFVDMRRQMISVFRGGHEIGTAVIVYGGNGHESPTGKFPILRMYRDYHSRSYDAPMPFSMFVTNDGVALHGSPMAADRATHGCIGLPISFARLLFEQASKGDVVEIVRSNAT
ncbi:hypothetical protein E3U23_07765 [Erythrobacter litoralis]|uniref:L,D-transpeptidase family protein n=1 Tax=Erythrobacter litoralis TaxID=39960 RepID=UPI002435EA05|nr:L,D-transpeptidase family protein [Erythrobacter litoralis]MDG6079086.1 hypothetical protein [Erythrobacter litoralis]